MSITSNTPVLALLKTLRVNRESNAHALFCIAVNASEDHLAGLIRDYAPIAYKGMTAKTLKTFVGFPSISDGLAVAGFEKNLEKRSHFWLQCASGILPENAKSILAERNAEVLAWLEESKAAGEKLAVEKEKAKKVAKDKRDEKKRVESEQATEAAKILDAVVAVPVDEVKALRLRVSVLEAEKAKLVQKYDDLEAQADKAHKEWAASEEQNNNLKLEIESLKAALVLAQAPLPKTRRTAKAV